MIKVNYECVSKCLLHCLEQTESKNMVIEALVHSDGLTKHGVLAMCENLRNEERNVKSSDSLLQNATVRSWVYLQPHSFMLLLAMC